MKLIKIYFKISQYIHNTFFEFQYYLYFTGFMKKHKRDHSKSRDRNRSRDRERRRSKSRQRDYKRDEKKDDRKRSRFTDGPADQQTTHQASILSSKLQQNLFGSKQEVKNLPILQKLNPANKNLGIGLTLVPSSGGFPLGLNTSVFSLLTDASKIKRKITLPKQSNFNYSGLLIGPKGNNQKQLEQRTGCKILVRGKGSQGQAPELDEDEDLHVLILGDNQTQVAKACAQIQRIIFADEETLNKIKQQQMKQHQQGITEGQGSYDLSLTTPYGPPSENAYILQVPNQCVGLVIGKQGQTIKNIAKKSGALKVQVATTSAPGSKTRNIFVQGDPESVDRVRKQLFAIVQTQRKMNSGAVAGSHRIDVQVPVRLIGLVIGKNGQTIKGINAKTGAFVCLSKQQNYDRNRKILTITGPEDLCLIAKYEIQIIIHNGLKNLQRQGGLTQSQLRMIKPITPISQQLAQQNLPIPTQVQTIKQDPTMPHFMNQNLQTQIPVSKLFQQFLGPTEAQIEQTIIQDERPKKKKKLLP